MAANQQGVIDGLQKLAGPISQLMFEPDASQHLQFIQGLQQAIVTYVQQQQGQVAAQAAQAGQQAATMGAGMGQPGGSDAGMAGMGMAPSGGGGSPVGSPTGGGMAPLDPTQMGAGGGSGMVGLAASPNPDELRRLLGQGSQGG